MATENASHGRTRPCLWMSAGLLSYKLCDRDFDCEQCPLDAAMRCQSPGSLSREMLLAPTGDSPDFPEDRVFTTGHTWLQIEGDRDSRLLKFGIDAFAAAILGCCAGVTGPSCPHTLDRGATVCRIDVGMGTLSVSTPVNGTLVNGNPALREQPDQVVSAPYRGGWLAELIAADVGELQDLMPAEVAREKARLDLQRFRRRVALHLLAEDQGQIGHCLADGGELVTDLRQMLGGPAYLEVARELIH